ncbi:MAG: helix-turn-helix domain-containing protein [Candidatus Woesearchaeota archaeon]
MSINLQQFGLSPGESKVYLCLLESGPLTTGILARKAKVSASNIYDILERLQFKGLVSYIMVENIRTYQVTNFNQFSEYLEKEKSEVEKKITSFNALLPQLEMYKQLSSELAAQIYSGAKGIKSAYVDLFASRLSSEFFYVHEEAYHEISSNFYRKNLRLWKSVHIKGIVNASFLKTKLFKSLKGMDIRYVSYPLPGCIDLCGEKVLIITWHTPATAILITSKSLSDQMRQYFNSVWKTAKKV